MIKTLVLYTKIKHSESSVITASLFHGCCTVIKQVLGIPRKFCHVTTESRDYISITFVDYPFPPNFSLNSSLSVFLGVSNIELVSHWAQGRWVVPEMFSANCLRCLC